MTNLSLFAHLLLRVGLICGLIPAIIFVYVAEKLVRAHRVPARNLFGKVVSDGKPIAKKESLRCAA